MKKVVAYCRVSTDSENQANSLENQQTYFQNVLEHSKNCKLINIYADRGLTGTKLNNRPEFKYFIVHYPAGTNPVNKPLSPGVIIPAPLKSGRQCKIIDIK